MDQSKVQKEEVGFSKGKYDPVLTTVFSNSLGPRKPFTKPIRQRELSQRKEDPVEQPLSQPKLASASKPSVYTDYLPNQQRKRKDAENNLEGRYMRQLAGQEIKEADDYGRTGPKKRRKHPKVSNPVEADASFDACTGSVSGNAEAGTMDEDIPLSDVPQHESLIPWEEDGDLEKSSRTVFLANVSTLAIISKSAKKILLDHLTSFFPPPPKQGPKNGIESLRFRSTAFARTCVPRKVAFAQKKLMPTTTRSTNAYAVYTTPLAAREAAKKLNGTMVLERHLRVDLVAHPAKIDHRRCVFVGNLGFVDDPSNISEADDKDSNKRPRKDKMPGDIEEGLWRQFSKAGTVESVRVVRDRTTRVGKGFAYIQFENANAVETALLYNEKNFPPMLPRALRVTRARNIKKSAGRKEKKSPLQKSENSMARYKTRLPSEIQSLNGRAGKLLGRAGAAQFRAGREKHGANSKRTDNVGKTPDSVLFEGYRASRHQRKGNPSARSKLFKAKGKKKS